MKILLLSKRQYTGKDLLNDKYGRLFEIPMELAELGHIIFGVCLSYRPRPEGQIYGPDLDGAKVTWYSWNLGKLIFPGIMRYLWNVKKIMKEFSPELILASSDAIHIIIGKIVSKLYKVPLVVDLYDNYESFGLTKVPGISKLFRAAVNSAEGVICVSKSLADHVVATLNVKGKIIVVENGVPAHFFYKMDKVECRRKFRLPPEGQIIGTAGALAENRGIDQLFQVFNDLSKKENNLFLALAGSLERGVEIPQSEKVYYLGELDHKEIPSFLNCLDVAVVCNKMSSFGKYCYPQKIVEIFACQVPVIAAGTSDIHLLFADDPDAIYEPGDLQTLKEAILIKLDDRTVSKNKALTWTDFSKRIDIFIKNLKKELT